LLDILNLSPILLDFLETDLYKIYKIVNGMYNKLKHQQLVSCRKKNAPLKSGKKCIQNLINVPYTMGFGNTVLTLAVIHL